MSEDEIVITKKALEVIFIGLHTWNTICLDSLTKDGRRKLFDAQDLVEKIRRENK